MCIIFTVVGNMLATIVWVAIKLVNSGSPGDGHFGDALIFHAGSPEV